MTDDDDDEHHGDNKVKAAICALRSLFPQFALDYYPVSANCQLIPLNLMRRIRRYRRFSFAFFLYGYTRELSRRMRGFASVDKLTFYCEVVG